jgi:hypothetical protein
MCDSDRERYGGPEWVEISLADLLDEETGLIEQVELAWDMSPMEFVGGIIRETTKALRAMIWLARRKAGCRDTAATFKPKTQTWSGVVYEPLPAEQQAADADPPANRAALRASKKAGGRKNRAASKTSSTSTTSDSSGTSIPSPAMSVGGPTGSS